MQKAFEKIIEKVKEEYDEVNPYVSRHVVKIVNQVAEEVGISKMEMGVAKNAITITSLDEVINRLQYKADNIKAKLEPTYFTECIDYLRTLNDGWILLTDDEASYPKPFEYVLVQDDIGDMNVAYCDPDYNWYISNGEDSLRLIGDIIAWQPLPQSYQPKGE